MALKVASRVECTATVTNYGNVTSIVANAGRQDFSFMSDGDYTYIYIQQGTLWEQCRATKSGTALVRATAEESSSGGSSVAFNGASPCTVFIDIPASKLLIKNSSGSLDNADPLLATVTVASISALKSAEVPGTDYLTRLVAYGATAGDGLGGLYYWDSAETETGDDYNYVVSNLSANGRWVRWATQFDIPTAANDAAVQIGAFARVSNVLKTKQPGRNDAIHLIPEVKNVARQGSFGTVAEFLAVSHLEWKTGDVIEIRGISADGDLRVPMLGIYNASETATTTGLYLRPTSTVSGGLSGRLALIVGPQGSSRLVKFGNGDGTPSIGNSRWFVTADTAPSAITGFDDMPDGAEIFVIPGAEAQVFEHSSTFKMPGAVDFTLNTDAAAAIFFKDNGVIRMIGGGGGGEVTAPNVNVTDSGARFTSSPKTVENVLAELHDEIGAAVGATNLSVSRNGTTVTVASDTGDDASLPAATTSLAGVMTAADKTKLDGIAAGAQVNVYNTSSDIATAYNSQVAQVSAGEKTAGTETAIRRFSPKDIADMSTAAASSSQAVNVSLTDTNGIWTTDNVQAAMEQAFYRITVRSISDGNITLTPSHLGALLLQANTSSLYTWTIDGTAAWAVGDTLHIMNADGAALMTITTSGGDTIWYNADGTAVSGGRGLLRTGICSLLYYATDKWVIIGNGIT